MRTPQEIAAFYPQDFDLAKRIYKGEA